MDLQDVYSAAREKEYWPLLCYFFYRASRHDWRLEVTASNLNFKAGNYSPLTIRVFDNEDYPDASDRHGIVVGVAQGDDNPDAAFGPVTGLRPPDLNNYTLVATVPYRGNIWAYVKLHSVEDIDNFFNEMAA